MKYPGMIIHSIGIALLSLWLFSSIINITWSNIENIPKEQEEIKVFR